MDSTVRVSLRLPKITFGDFVTSFNPGYPSGISEDVAWVERSETREVQHRT